MGNFFLIYKLNGPTRPSRHRPTFWRVRRSEHPTSGGFKISTYHAEKDRLNGPTRRVQPILSSLLSCLIFTLGQAMHSHYKIQRLCEIPLLS